MKFYKLSEKKPENGQWCWVIYRSGGGKLILNSWKRQWCGSAGTFGFDLNVAMWTPVPPHFLDEKRGWTVLDGTNDPVDGAYYCISEMKNRHVSIATYSEKISGFLGLAESDIIAYMRIPLPKGVR